ncbi:MAG: [protein-PII] uridylyltransferase [Opitutales bacterium]
MATLFTEDPLFRRIRKHAKQRLAKISKEDRGTRTKAYKRFLALEDKMLRRYHRQGDSGIRVTRSRAIIIDVLIETIYKDAITEASKEAKPPYKISVIATGGYGRCELCPFSDIDLLFLYPDTLRGESAQKYQEKLTEAILYPLWDLGLKVGHASRSIKETLIEAKSEVKSKNAILDTRLIIGDAKLFQRFERAIEKFLKKEDTSKYLQERFASQTARRKRQGDSVYVQEPDVKSGVGCLRDFQNILWMSRVRFGKGDFSSIIKNGYLKRSKAKRLKEAYSFLLRVRNEIHFRSSRPTDLLDLEAQPLVAWNLGYRQKNIFDRVESFMQVFYGHADVILNVSRYLEAKLARSNLPDKTPIKFMDVIRAHKGLSEKPRVIDGFVFQDGLITPQNKNVFKRDPVRLIRVFRHMQQYKMKLDLDLKNLISESVPLITRHVIDDPSASSAMRAILQSAGDVHRALIEMHDTRVLGRFIPEWQKLTCLVQHEYYHRYTADIHTLNTIKELDRVFNERDRLADLYRNALRQAQYPNLLYLILLLHDIGKGIAIKNHALNGVAIAEPILQRLDIPEDLRGQILFIIRHHLEMARFWQRFDLDDPKTPESFAEFIRDANQLSLLYVHTYCDACGTSEGLWNEYKNTLHTRLYRETFEVLKNKSTLSDQSRERKMSAYESIKERGITDISADEIEAHFSLLPERYFIHHTIPEIELHIRMINQLLTNIHEAESLGSLVPIIDWHDDLERSMTVVNIVTWDRAGLFYRLAGAFALAGLNILSSKAISRSDHITIDTFFVSEPRGGVVENPKARKIFSKAVNDALMLNKDLYPEILAQARKQEKRKLFSINNDNQLQAAIPPRVDVYHELSLQRTILEIQASDKIGLLYLIAHAIYKHGFDIAFARIATERSVAMDTFYIERINQETSADTNNLLSLRETLNQIIEEQTRTGTSE